MSTAPLGQSLAKPCSLVLAGLLAGSIGACGAGRPSTPPAILKSDAEPRPLSIKRAAALSRPPVRITSPDPGQVIPGQARGRDLTAVVRISGLAAPRQQLDVLGTCGAIECDTIAFADRNGRWRAELQLTAAAGRHLVRLRAKYAHPRPIDRQASVVSLRMSDAPKSAAHLPPASTQVRRTGPRPVVVIGDSLALGMSRYLQAALTGWPVSVSARIGRPLAEGMSILFQTQTPDPDTVLAFSLFTNDSPGNVALLDAAVREAVARAGQHGCVLWATISRPPLNGVSYAAANATLRALASDARLAGHLILVPWAEDVSLHPEWQVRDHVHATSEGYMAMARLFSDAARSCQE